MSCNYLHFLYGIFTDKCKTVTSNKFKKKMDSSRSRLLPMPRNNPFPQRPWMENNGAAAAAGGASGMKGKI